MKNIKIGCLFLISRELKTLFVGFLLVVIGCAVVFAQENQVKNKTIAFAIGNAAGKISEEDDNENDLNTQGTQGIMFNAVVSNAIGYEVNYFSGGVKVTTLSSIAKSTVALTVTELNLGARYYFDSPWQVQSFYVAGGLASISAEFDTKSDASVSIPGFVSVSTSGESQHSGSGNGSYFGVGVRHIFAGGFTLGLDIRDSNGSFVLARDKVTGVLVGTTIDSDLDKENYGLRRSSLTLGYNF